MIEVCKDCKKRKIGCHAACEDYIKALEDHHRQQAIIRKAKQLDYDLRIIESDRIKRYLKKRRKYGKSKKG